MPETRVLLMPYDNARVISCAQGQATWAIRAMTPLSVSMPKKRGSRSSEQIQKKSSPYYLHVFRKTLVPFI